MLKNSLLFFGGLQLGSFLVHQWKQSEIEKLVTESKQSDAFIECRVCISRFAKANLDYGDSPNKNGFKRYALELVRNHNTSTSSCVKYMYDFWKEVDRLDEEKRLPSDFWTKDDQKWEDRWKRYQEIGLPVYEYHNELEYLKCIGSSDNLTKILKLEKELTGGD